jgi:anti-sigma B factor antagonist
MGASDEFTITVSQRAGRAIVEVRGELDAATGPTLSDAVSALTRDGLAGVVINLDEVTFVDSKGLSALLDSHREATRRNMTLGVVNLQPAVAKLFRISGVDAVLLEDEVPN